MLIWFEINPSCELRLETSQEHRRVESCDFVSTLGHVGNTLWFGENAADLYLASFAVYNSDIGTQQYQLLYDR